MTDSFVHLNEIQYPLVFLIDDNAGPQHLVVITEIIKIYKLEDDLSKYCHDVTDSNKHQHWGKLRECFYNSNNKKLVRTINKFEGLWTGFDPSYYHLDFMSILIKLNEYNYIIIYNNEIYDFTTQEPVQDYISYMGENDVTYPYAVTDNYVYFFACSNSIINKKEIPFPITLENSERLIRWDC